MTTAHTRKRRSHGTDAPPRSRGARSLTPLQFLAYGGGDAANNLAFSLAVTFLPLYLTDVALISPATVGTIFLVMRFVDAFTDVIMGSVIDRTSTRIGKFRPWILAGSIPLIALAIANFAMPAGLHGTVWAVVWAAVAYFLMGSVAYTAVNIPYGSLAAAMTDNGTERSRLALFRSFGTAIMQVALALAISPALSAYAGDPDALQSALIRTLIPLGVLALALYVLLFAVSRENVRRSVDRVSLRSSLRTIASNRALQMLGASSIAYLLGLFAANGLVAYYTRDVLGSAGLLAVFVAAISGTVLVVGWAVPPLIRRLGKPRLFRLAAGVGVVGALILMLVPADMLWLAVLGALLFGASSGSVNAIMWNMEADTVEYGEWASGYRSEGTTYAVFSFLRKLAQALGGAVGIWMIGWFGYQGGVPAQSDSAVNGIRLAMGALPAAAMLLSILLMRFYPMDDAAHRRILADLDERARRE
ncbi:glycoside-pentoside-hexuronide (GPH):cation symporter [Brachybacterium endophyticum]|nr:glycoside-pentoside-hexuronide (GPH):cation symporter [Brachybacterium endophyticum]